jgi:transposase
MSRFRPVGRHSAYLLPPSIDEWLPEEHLARFVVEVVEGLDVSALERACAGRGSAAYPPEMLLSLLIHEYANGVFSSRKIEQATYDTIAFPFHSGRNAP